MEYIEEERVLVGNDGYEHKNISPVALGGATYYIELPERFCGALRLLKQGVDNAEQAYQLHVLLQALRDRAPVAAVNDRGEELDALTARATFFREVAEKERQHAAKLRDLLREKGAEW